MKGFVRSLDRRIDDEKSQPESQSQDQKNAGWVVPKGTIRQNLHLALASPTVIVHYPLRLKKTILITGANGFLASEFRLHAERSDHGATQFFFKTREELDIGDSGAVRKSLYQIKPDIVINCAAFRDIDQAETHREEAYRVNVLGVKNLAEACIQYGPKLVHFSTHGIFDGEKGAPYVESDSAAPLNYYGATKLQGEREALAHLPADRLLILRISWPYGERGNNFIWKILRIAREHSSVRVVADQWGVPNPAELLVRKTLQIIGEAQGLLHLSCTGYCSRYELISFLLDYLKIDCQVIPVSAKEFPTAAPRPRNIAIATERVEWGQNLRMPDWKQALTEFLHRKGKQL